MANTFKLKTFDGSSTAASTAMTVYTAPSATTTVVIGLNLANLTSSTVNVDITITNNDGDNIYFAKGVPVPAGGALEIMSGNKLILEASDVLEITSDTANSVDTALSIMEQT
jgi:hypothetical protein